MNRGEPCYLGKKMIRDLEGFFDLMKTGNGASGKSQTKVCLLNMLIISFTQVSFEHHFQRNNSIKSTTHHPLQLA